MHEIGTNQRTGTVNFRSSKLKFKGESASKVTNDNMSKSKNESYKKVKAYKPFDSLCCAVGVKFSDVTQNRKDFPRYKEYSPAK